MKMREILEWAGPRSKKVIERRKPLLDEVKELRDDPEILEAFRQKVRDKGIADDDIFWTAARKLRPDLFSAD